MLASRKFSGTMPPTTMGDILFIAGAVSPRPDPFDELDARVIPLANSAVALGLDQTMVSEIIAASGRRDLLDRDRAGRLTGAERRQSFRRILHIGVVRSFAALRYHPVDVLRRILMSQVLQVHAVLGVDLQARGGVFTLTIS